MTKNNLIRIFSGLLIVAFQNCNSPISETIKFQQTDPFIKAITPSQFFSIDGKKDNIVEGKDGTIVICPKGSFKKANGKVVEDSIRLELTEALSIDDIVLSNLTTTSEGKLLETEGMIYFNATSNGEQLLINKENPVHFEIPTSIKKPGMMAYKGSRDANGNMNWTNPKEIDKYLQTVDIMSLDFLPFGFQQQVDLGMPFRKHKVATQELIDSIYYSLSRDDKYLFESRATQSQFYESHYSKNATDQEVFHLPGTLDSTRAESTVVYGIDPAIIRTIKSNKYQNTLIATKEFAMRVKMMFQTCDNSVIDTYIKNLDKNLFELDSMAAAICKKNEQYRFYKVFKDFSRQRLTKVGDADKYSELLKGYYEKELQKVKTDLAIAKEKFIKEAAQENETTRKLKIEYQELLWKREKYRMETYGFNWTETGWVNIDNGTLPKNWGSQPLEVIVENGKDFDQVYTYVIYWSIKSLYRLNTDDNKNFFVGSSQSKEMLMPKAQPAIVIAIGYKNNEPALAIKEFETSESKLTVELLSTTLIKMKESIKPYERFSRENSISQDVTYMTKLYNEDGTRKKQSRKDAEFLLKLWHVAFPCCLGLENYDESPDCSDPRDSL